MKKYLAIFISLIFLIPLLLALFIKEIPNNGQPSLEGTQIIYKDVKTQQSFKSEMSNLSGIGMSIKNPYFRNKKDLVFKLLTEEKQIIRTVTVNGANIPDGDFIRINFEKIPDSKNKQYVLSLDSPNTESNESLEVFLTSQKVPWLDDFYVNSQKQPYKFSMNTYHKSSNIFTNATEIFSQMLKRLFADLPFALLYLGLIGALSSYFLYLHKKN